MESRWRLPRMWALRRDAVYAVLSLPTLEQGACRSLASDASGASSGGMTPTNIGKFVCRVCRSTHSIVWDARWDDIEYVYRRRRRCLQCGANYKTVEVHEARLGQRERDEPDAA